MPTYVGTVSKVVTKPKRGFTLVISAGPPPVTESFIVADDADWDLVVAAWASNPPKNIQVDTGDVNPPGPASVSGL